MAERHENFYSEDEALACQAQHIGADIIARKGHGMMLNGEWSYVIPEDRPSWTVYWDEDVLNRYFYTRKADSHRSPLVQVQPPPQRGGRSWVHPSAPVGVNRYPFTYRHIENSTKNDKFPDVWEFDTNKKAPLQALTPARELLLYAGTVFTADVLGESDCFGALEGDPALLMV